MSVKAATTVSISPLATSVSSCALSNLPDMLGSRSFRRWYGSLDAWCDAAARRVRAWRISLGKLAFLLLRPSNLLLLLALRGLLAVALRPRAGPLRLAAGAVLVMAVCTLLPVGDWLIDPARGPLSRRRRPIPRRRRRHRRAGRRDRRPGSPGARPAELSRDHGAVRRDPGTGAALSGRQDPVHRRCGLDRRRATADRGRGDRRASSPRRACPTAGSILEDRARSTRENALSCPAAGPPAAGRALAAGHLGHAHAARRSACFAAPAGPS